MSKHRTICDVVPDPGSLGKWLIRCQDSSFTEQSAPDRDDAIWHGRQYAQRFRPSLLRVHRADGTLEAEFPYR